MIREIDGDALPKIQNPKPTTRCQDCGAVIPNNYTDNEQFCPVCLDNYTDNEQFCPVCLDMRRKRTRSDHAAKDRRQARLI